MTAGRGFISRMIFGNWTLRHWAPQPCLVTPGFTKRILLAGVTDSPVCLMLPYVVTIIAVSGLVVPAALRRLEPYDPEEQMMSNRCWRFGDRKIFRGVVIRMSLSLNSGEILALLGENGAGNQRWWTSFMDLSAFIRGNSCQRKTSKMRSQGMPWSWDWNGPSAFSWSRCDYCRKRDLGSEMLRNGFWTENRFPNWYWIFQVTVE